MRTPTTWLAVTHIAMKGQMVEKQKRGHEIRGRKQRKTSMQERKVKTEIVTHFILSPATYKFSSTHSKQHRSATAVVHWQKGTSVKIAINTHLKKGLTESERINKWKNVDDGYHRLIPLPSGNHFAPFFCDLDLNPSLLLLLFQSVDYSRSHT